MVSYILRRILSTVPVMAIVALFVFAIVHSGAQAGPVASLHVR